MKRLDQRGKINGLFLPFTLAVVGFVVVLIFAIWAFAGREDYKKNVDKKIAVAVAAAQQATSTKKDNEFVEKEKDPLKTYVGPEAYGRLSVQFPKTWSALVSETVAANPVDAYFYPKIIPGGGGGTVLATTSYALRVQILSVAYDVAAKSFDALSISGVSKVTAFKPAKVSGVVGIKVDGTIIAGKTGSMVILPLRDKTIEIWTESNQYLTDFDNYVLPSLTYVP